jgi:hypothetical protein
MKYKINDSDIGVIIAAIKDSELATKIERIKKDGQFVEKDKYPTGRYVIEVSDVESEKIIDSLSEQLMNVGVDESGEPNALGKQIESLIDTFSVS